MIGKWTKKNFLIELDDYFSPNEIKTTTFYIKAYEIDKSYRHNFYFNHFKTKDTLFNINLELYATNENNVMGIDLINNDLGGLTTSDSAFFLSDLKNPIFLCSVQDKQQAFALTINVENMENTGKNINFAFFLLMENF